jgi:hypothetical protein
MSPAQRIEHLNRLLASTSPGEYERLSRIAEGRLAAGDEPPQAVAAMRRQGVPELLAQHVVDEQFAAQKTRLRMRGLLQLGGGILLVALAALLWNTDSSDLPAPGRRGLNKLAVWCSRPTACSASSAAASTATARSTCSPPTLQLPTGSPSGRVCRPRRCWRQLS